MDKADVVAMYFGPEAKGPITLLELGLVARKERVVVCCPGGYWKRGNVLVVCQRLGVKVVNTLEELTSGVLDALKEIGFDTDQTGK